MNYIRLHIIYPSDEQEIFIAELLDMDFEGFQQEGDLLIASIPQNRYDDLKRETIEQILIRQHTEGGIIKEELVEPQNWNEMWEQSIQPQFIGDFVIHPTWNDIQVDDDLIEIILDPKMAFGTGYHETTQLILEWLPQLVKGEESVLDAGTGTGVLSIAAIKLGAEEAFGFDIDEWSKTNAEENAHLNDVTDQCEFELGSIEVVADDARYNLILGNINRNALLSMVPDLEKHLAANGLLLLSGLLKQDEVDIMTLADELDLKHIDTRQKNEWIAVLFEHESSH